MRTGGRTPADERTGRAPRVHLHGEDGPFVGRTDVLAELDRRWVAATQGEPQLVLVEGPSSIGKSSLVRGFLRHRPEATVVWTSGDELEADFAFGVAAQLLNADPLELQQHDDELAVGVLLLAEISEREQAGPFVVVIDDIGWADVPSLRSLSFALRRLRAGPVLVIATTRPELTVRLPSGLLGAIDARGGRVVLQGLGPADVGELARALGHGTLPARVLGRLVAHTSGNPMHLRALLAETDPATLLREDTDPLPAPRSMVELLLTRLQSLPPDAGSLAAAVSVLGVGPSLALAAEVGAVQDPRRSLEALVLAGLARTEPGPTGPVVELVHPLVRSAIYHGMPLGRRVELHHRAAELVGDQLVVLRHRAAAVTTFDDELARELAQVAEGRIHLPAGGAEAGAWFQLAARVSSRRASRERFVLRALEAHLAAGDRASAAGLAGELSSFEDTPLRRYLQGTLHLFEGDLAAAEAALEEAWAAVAIERDPGLAAAIAGRRSWIFSHHGDLDEALRWSDRSIELDPNDSRATFTRILSLVGSGRADQARAACELDAASAHDTALRVALLAGRGVLELWMDDPEQSRAHLLRAVDDAQELSNFYPFATASAYCADAEFRLGRWDEAVQRAELISSLAADLDLEWFLPLPHAKAALVAANRGQWDAAEHHVATARSVALASDDAFSVMWARTAEAALALARGDHTSALEAAVACLDHPGVSRLPDAGMTPWRVLGAEAAAALGHVDVGHRLLAGLDPAAGRIVTPALGLARARAQLAVAAGDDATAHLERGRELAARTPSPFEQARFQLVEGTYWRRRGQRRRAAEVLALARATFADLQAAPWSERTERELASASSSTARHDGRHRVELTPQEQSVVRLVAQGQRNREVAAELFVNVKTVEYHLSSVYRKLGVSNRTQLVAALHNAR